MKYPEHTVSQPVIGKQAKSLLRAIDAGKSFTNTKAQATIKRILEGHAAKPQKLDEQKRRKTVHQN